MWASIRSDLEEFVSTVKDESATVTKTLARKDDQDEQQQTTASQEEGTPSAPESANSLIMVGEDGDLVYDNDDAAVAAEEVERLMSEPETFLDPLDEEDPDVAEFLTTFDLEAKTDEISQLLEANPETLKFQFESLVPTEVQYKDFWQRCYFRCDEERILREWEREQEEARRARAEAIAAGVNSVKNLFGGAVKAVTNVGAVKAVSSRLEQMDHGQDEGAAAQGGGGHGLFGGHRPPFVMNTAVDEDDDDEQEDEEELGWDDDEESLVEEEGDDEALDDNEEIHFSGGKDEELENLKRQLSQAMEEREQLHQTVAMQSEQLAAAMQPGQTAVVASTDELEKFKMMIFEKDAELAALRASLDDTQDDDRDAVAKKDTAKVASLERDFQRMEIALSSRDKELQELQQELERTRAEAEQLRGEVQSTKAQVLEAQEGRSELERQIASLKEMLAASQSETESLRVSFESYKRDSASQDLQSQEETNAAFAKMELMESELEEAKGNLEFTVKRADHLEQELQKKMEEMQEKESAFEAKLAEEVAKFHAEHEQASRDSMSTGVKVSEELDMAAPAQVTHLASNDDGEADDWGDDWGDEDD